MAKESKTTFVLCDSASTNTYGFRIDLDGMDLDRFRSNPVMLYSHDSEQLIGRWENIRIEEGRLLADPVFDMEDELAKKVAGRVSRGFLKGSSVGIIIREMTETETVAVATRTELMEASLCPIPSDAGAIVLYDENRRRLSIDEINIKLLKYNKMNEEQKKEQTTLEQQLAAKDQRIAELEAKIAEQARERTEAFLSAAVNDGRISAAEKDGFAKLAEKDFDTVKGIVEARKAKPTATLREQVSRSSGIAAERDAWSYLDWMKKDPEGLKKMKSENPTAFAALQQTLK